MTINNEEVFKEMQVFLSYSDTKKRNRNKKYLREALKDLTQLQRAHLHLIFQGKGDINSLLAKEIVEVIGNNWNERYSRDLNGQRNTYFSVRTAPNAPRIKSIWKSFLRGLSNKGSRITSKDLFKFIEKSTISFNPLPTPSSSAPSAYSDPSESSTPSEHSSLVTDLPSEGILNFKNTQLHLLICILFKKNEGIITQATIDNELVNLTITDTFKGIINIQIFNDTTGDTNKLGLKIDSIGNLLAIYIDDEEIQDAEGKKSLQIPNKYLPYFDACYKESLKLSSQYIPNKCWEIEISLIGEGLKEVSGFHLEQLTKAIVHTIRHDGTNPALEVKFLGHTLEIGPSVDAGGLAREYVDSLGKGLLGNPPVYLNKNFGDLAFPNAGIAMPDGAFSKLTNQEKEFYMQIGQLLMFCYNSEKDENYSTGQFLDLTVIKGALSLSGAEINTPFDSLSDKSVKKMLETIASSLLISNPSEGIAGILKNYNLAINLYDWKKGDPIPSRKILEAAHGLMGNSLLGNDFLEESYYKYMDADTFLPLCDEIEKLENIENFITHAKQAIVTQNFDFMPPIADYLASVHQIAVGMKSVCRPGAINKAKENTKWNKIFMHNLDFNDKVQGSLDRQKISKLISNGTLQGDSQEFMNKSKWLREWIEKEATNHEVEAFLKYVTGSSSISPHTTLSIRPLRDESDGIPLSPYPVAHTCFNQLNISNTYCGNDEYHDRDKKGFIRCLKAVMVESGALFSSI